MVVSVKLIDAFLETPPRMFTSCKGVAPDVLDSLIYNCTGMRYREDNSTKLRPYQFEALAFALNTRQGAMLMLDMQLGKSIVALRWAEHLRRAGIWKGRGLIVAHAPVGLYVWAGEARKHSTLKLACVQNSAAELADACESDADLIAVPWAGLQNIFSRKGVISRGKRTGQTKLYPDLDLLRDVAPEFSLVIVDEIHRAQDPYGLWFQIARELTAQTRFRLGLTGTPLGRDPFGMWTQSYLMDRGDTLGRSYGFFEQAFGYRQKSRFHPGGAVWKFRKRRLPILQQKLAHMSFAYIRSEVRPADIKPSRVELAMTAPQADAYTSDLGEVIKSKSTDHHEHHFQRLRQIASGFLPYTNARGEAKVVNFPASSKLEWIDGMLANLGDARLVIFHDFVHSGELLCKVLAKRQISHRWIWGGGDDNAGGVAAFQTGKAQVLVANAATGGMSINLSVADYLVFYECPLSSRTRTQAEARPLADRGTRPLFITDLICAPIEQRILDLVQEGKTVNASLMREAPKLVLRN